MIELLTTAFMRGSTQIKKLRSIYSQNEWMYEKNMKKGLYAAESRSRYENPEKFKNLSLLTLIGFSERKMW